MSEFLLLLALALIVVFVLVLPWWLSQRRRHLTSRLSRYQAVAEALLENDLPGAREGLKEIVRSDTEDVAAYLRLARIFRREGDHERAAALYRNLRARELRDRQQRLDVIAGLVEELFELQRYEEARAVAAELRQLDRRHPLIAQVEFEEALQAPDFERALKACDRLAKSVPAGRGPRPAAARTFVAGRLLDAGQLREARRALEQALEDDGGYAPALLLLGEVHSRKNEFTKAADTWTLLLRKHPAAAAGVIDRLEKAYFEMGRFGELGHLYTELAAAPDSAPMVRLASARMALRRGDVPESLAQVESLLEQEPDLSDAHDWRTFLLLEAGRQEEARQHLKERIEARVAVVAETACPSCSGPVSWATVRCERCAAWLPDPFGHGGR